MRGVSEDRSVGMGALDSAFAGVPSLEPVGAAEKRRRPSAHGSEHLGVVADFVILLCRSFGF